MSLWGDWTRTPGRRGPAARVVVEALELRLDGRRDNVALLYFLALKGLADHAGHGLVGIDRNDLDFPQVFGVRLGAEDGQLMTIDQPVVGTDRHHDPTVGRIDLFDFAHDRRRTLQAFDLADVIRKA